MDILHRWSSLLALLIGLCLFLLLVVMPVSAAGNAEPDCSQGSISDAFKNKYPEALHKGDDLVPPSNMGNFLLAVSLRAL